MHLFEQCKRKQVAQGDGTPSRLGASSAMANLALASKKLVEKASRLLQELLSPLLLLQHTPAYLELHSKIRGLSPAKATSLIGVCSLL